VPEHRQLNQVKLLQKIKVKKAAGGFAARLLRVPWIPGVGKECANPLRQNIKKFKKMKTNIISTVIFLLTIFFTGCNNDEMPGKNLPKASAGSVQVKLEATASPILKDGGDDEDPEPMFEITGFVTQNGNPVLAEVELLSMPQSTLVNSTNTDSNGGFGFSKVTAGLYNVIVYVDGNVADTIVVNL
jgi:hypothetical protein